MKALNKRCFRSSFLQLFSTATLYSLFLLMLTAYLGFAGFMSDVKSRLGNALVVQVSTPRDILLILPDNLSYGSGLIITRDGYRVLEDIFQAFQVLTLLIAVIFTVSQVSGGVRVLRAEVKTNQALFEALRSSIVPKRTIITAYLADRLVKSLGSVLLGLTASWLVVFPLLDLALADNLLHYYLVLDRNLLAVFSGGLPSLFNFGLDYFLLRRSIP